MTTVAGNVQTYRGTIRNLDSRPGSQAFWLGQTFVVVGSAAKGTDLAEGDLVAIEGLLNSDGQLEAQQITKLAGRGAAVVPAWVPYALAALAVAAGLMFVLAAASGM